MVILDLGPSSFSTKNEGIKTKMTGHAFHYLVYGYYLCYYGKSDYMGLLNNVFTVNSLVEVVLLFYFRILERAFIQNTKKICCKNSVKSLFSAPVFETRFYWRVYGK